MGTPHNNAEKGDIAKRVLMPGDPLRAKYIADNFLEDVVCFNTVRNMFGYTGTYKGQKVSVMGGGMGIPSTAIYTYELFNMYDVDEIIRIGTTGALPDEIHAKDIIIAMGACTDSNYAHTFHLPGTYAPIASFDLLEKAVAAARKLDIPVHVGNVLSSDVFYVEDQTENDKWRDMGVLGLEMESTALYMNAAKAKKKALCILTVSDHVYRHEDLTPEERQTSLNDMIKIALEI